ncbi:hypothetical protein BDN72DRAFT_851788 [Pluteus cervinus]|uniref:Uncharacterized protein n=1 Tax=Pluteus cervinus TaxID=181527 RepID=A0ACD2ZY25_9AGAR|nr:hypothetical protein BDN72DRAFT_851788 [Pluteus cervinus]
MDVPKRREQPLFVSKKENTLQEQMNELKSFMQELEFKMEQLETSVSFLKSEAGRQDAELWSLEREISSLKSSGTKQPQEEFGTEIIGSLNSLEFQLQEETRNRNAQCTDLSSKISQLYLLFGLDESE